MTDAGRDEGTQHTTYEQVKDDEHVILNTFHDTLKTEVPFQSSSVSSDFANQFLNLDNIPPTDSEVISIMNVKVHHEEASTQIPPLLNIPITVILETSSAVGLTIPLTIPPITPLQQQSTPTPAPILLRNLSGHTLQKFEKKAKDERKRYIDLVEKSVKEIIKDEDKNQLPEILPKEVSDYATPVIQSSITESLKNIVLTKSSSQPKSTYEAAELLTEFELKKILLDKIQKSKSYRVYSLKRDREDKDKDEDPPSGSDQGLKKQKMSKDAEPSRGSKSKESKSSSSKGSKSQSKSSGKSAQTEEPVFETVDTEMPLNQGEDLGNTDDQPNVEATLKDDWFKKPQRPSNPDSDWNTTKSRVELEYHFEECYKVVIDRLDWSNPEGHKYPFDLSMPLPFIKDQGRQVVPANYFINNDLEYLKGGSLSKKYTTSTAKTKVTKYDTIEGIEDMVSSLWSPVKVAYDKYAIIITVTHVKVMKWYDYGYLEEIEVRREDQHLYKFREGNFPRLNLHYIEDMLLLLVQKKLSNLERDVIYDLNVALWMFTRCVVILKRVEDLQLGVKSYQKKLNITKHETFRLMRSDELYKFYDGTLTSVRRVLHDIASSLEMDYLPKRR
ncbi:hypothetical protein Tco_1211887 [Tanacetum coccineum]